MVIEIIHVFEIRVISGKDHFKILKCQTIRLTPKVNFSLKNMGEIFLLSASKATKKHIFETCGQTMYLETLFKQSSTRGEKRTIVCKGSNYGTYFTLLGCAPVILQSFFVMFSN